MNENARLSFVINVIFGRTSTSAEFGIEMNRLWHSDTVEAMRYPYEKNLINKEKREKTLPGQQYWQDYFPV